MRQAQTMHLNVRLTDTTNERTARVNYIHEVLSQGLSSTIATLEIFAPWNKSDSILMTNLTLPS
jgi:hypothetical protein